MSYVKYVGRKKDFGPLKKKWMNKPVKFINNVSEEIDPDTAQAILVSMPDLFIEVVPVANKPAPKPIKPKSRKRKK